jgi:uncharacterized tellurite resistance protein B-like protein
MPRWSSKVEDSFTIDQNFESTDHILKDFFQNRAFIPENDEERQMLDEFSLVTSAMAIMIYVADADSEINDSERKKIIEDMIFQLKQRHRDYVKLAKEFGQEERKIIEGVFNKLLTEYKEDKLSIDETIETINKIYDNNPFSRNFVIRLCYHTALSDNCLGEVERNTIDDIADRLNVSNDDKVRMFKEVENELMKAGKATC